MNKILLTILLFINLNYSLAFSGIIDHICIDIKKNLLDDDSISYYNTEIKINHRIKKKEKIVYKITKKKKIPLDIIGIRIIYDSDNEDISFKILDNIERNFHKIPGTYKNYINNKKKNGYQSLHLFISYNFIPVEIQIRNTEMDYVINYGEPSNYI